MAILSGVPVFWANMVASVSGCLFCLCIAEDKTLFHAKSTDSTYFSTKIMLWVPIRLSSSEGFH